MGSRVRYERDSVEFNRVIALTDGIFAVAMTLLVVSIGIPDVPADELVPALISSHGDLLTFFISVALLAFYWLSNHHFVRHLSAIDPVYAGLNMIYLGLISFLPLPTALLDRYSSEPITPILFVSTLLLISLMELVLFRCALSRDLMTDRPTDRVEHYSVLIILIPVLVFLLAVPIGLMSSPTYALAIWVLLNFPLRLLIERRIGPSTAGPYI